MDLFYRLNVVTIELPPLRDRVEDIAPLVDHFLRKHRDPGSESARTVTAEALARLEAYDWPGNVRELENLVRSALVFGTTQSLGLEDLPASLLSERRGSGPNLFELVREIVASEDWSEERPLLPRLELLLTHEAVKRLGNKTLAARRLGITKPTLYARLRRYDALFGESAEENSGN
jgi:two-component system response regulator HydG